MLQNFKSRFLPKIAYPVVVYFLSQSNLCVIGVRTWTGANTMSVAKFQFTSPVHGKELTARSSSHKARIWLTLTQGDPDRSQFTIL